jgi:hypothetical protein
MQINLWYCNKMEQWRWTLCGNDDDETLWQESGQRADLRIAMNDVATTVEYLLKEKSVVR